MVYIVTLNYTKFKFLDGQTAMSFATLAKQSCVDSKTEVEIEVVVEEDDF